MALLDRMNRTRREYEVTPLCSYLYGIEGAGLLKIGHTMDVGRRLMELQIGSPVPLTLLFEAHEEVLTETEAHASWSHLRQHGEWFTLTPELRAWAEGMRLRGNQYTSKVERASRLAYGPEVRRLHRLNRRVATFNPAGAS